MLTSKRASLSYSVTTWALRSSALLMLYAVTFLFLHYGARMLKRLCPPPSLLQHTSSPRLPAASRQKPHHKTHSLVTSLLSRRGQRCFYLVRDTRPPSLQETVSRKNIKDHMAPYRNSLIGNHSTAHSENAGAVVHPPQLLKPLCFHSTVNKD